MEHITPHTPIRNPNSMGKFMGTGVPSLVSLGLRKFIGIHSLHGLCITWNSHGYDRQPLANPHEIDDFLLVLVIFYLWKKQTNWNITKNNKWKRILFSRNFVQNLGYFCKRSFFSTSRKWPRFSFDPSSWLAHLWAPSDHWFPTRGWPWPSVPYAPSFGPLPWEWAWGSAPRVKMVRSWDRNDEVNPPTDLVGGFNPSEKY